jgi:hypothetical protein
LLLRQLRHSKFDLLYEEIWAEAEKVTKSNIRKRFDSLHESLGLLGGLGSEGYQLLPAAGAAFYQAGFEDARLSLRDAIRATTEEKLPDQFKQTEREKNFPARIGIELPQDLRPESGRTLALAAVYECNKKPDSAWEVSHEDEWGHWVAVVGKGHVPETHSKALRGYNGIILDSNRGHELWKLDGQSGLWLNRPGDPSEIRVWVYSLITIQIDESK